MQILESFCDLAVFWEVCCSACRSGVLLSMFLMTWRRFLECVCSFGTHTLCILEVLLLCCILYNMVFASINVAYI